MIVEAIIEFFVGIFKYILVVCLIIIAFIVIGMHYFMSDNKIYKFKEPVKPTVEINSKTINGLTVSDTTYIYDFTDK